MTLQFDQQRCVDVEVLLTRLRNRLGFAPTSSSPPSLAVFLGLSICQTEAAEEDWGYGTDLPKPALFEIFSRLRTTRDLFRCFAVCHSWRAFLSSEPGVLGRLEIIAEGLSTVQILLGGRRRLFDEIAGIDGAKAKASGLYGFLSESARAGLFTSVLFQSANDANLLDSDRGPSVLLRALVEGLGARRREGKVMPPLEITANPDATMKDLFWIVASEALPVDLLTLSPVDANSLRDVGLVKTLHTLITPEGELLIRRFGIGTGMGLISSFGPSEPVFAAQSPETHAEVPTPLSAALGSLRRLERLTIDLKNDVQGLDRETVARLSQRGGGALRALAVWNISAPAVQSVLENVADLGDTLAELSLQFKAIPSSAMLSAALACQTNLEELSLAGDVKDSWFGGPGGLGGPSGTNTPPQSFPAPSAILPEPTHFLRLASLSLDPLTGQEQWVDLVTNVLPSLPSLRTLDVVLKIKSSQTSFGINTDDLRSMFMSLQGAGDGPAPPAPQNQGLDAAAADELQEDPPAAASAAPAPQDSAGPSSSAASTSTWSRAFGDFASGVARDRAPPSNYPLVVTPDFYTALGLPVPPNLPSLTPAVAAQNAGPSQATTTMSTQGIPRSMYGLGGGGGALGSGPGPASLPNGGGGGFGGFGAPAAPPAADRFSWYSDAAMEPQSPVLENLPRYVLSGPALPCRGLEALSLEVFVRGAAQVDFGGLVEGFGGLRDLRLQWSAPPLNGGPLSVLLPRDLSATPHLGLLFVALDEADQVRLPGRLPSAWRQQVVRAPCSDPHMLVIGEEDETNFRTRKLGGAEGGNGPGSPGREVPSWSKARLGTDLKLENKGFGSPTLYLRAGCKVLKPIGEKARPQPF